MNCVRLRSQSGQALIFALFFLLIGCLALFFLFSAGQITADKMRVTNTADAAAYSGAVWRARVLNYDAYTNRAIVANEIAIAQYLTLDNWVRYLSITANNINDYTQFIPYVGEVTSEIASVADEAKELTDVETEYAVPIRDKYEKMAIANSQEILHAAANPVAMQLVINQVISANGPNFKGLTLIGSDDFLSFTRNYSGDDRMRMAHVILDSRDGFTTDRPWNLGLELSCFLPPTGELRKRGGTSLKTLDRWDSVDTLSFHYQVVVKDWLGIPHCEERETPVGWGGTSSPNADDGGFANSDVIGGNFGGSQGTNPSAHGDADNDRVDTSGYTGVAVVRELNDQQLQNPNPTTRFAVVVKTVPGSTRTSDQVGLAAGRMKLGDNLDGNSIAAVSAAEVYFMRPTDVGSAARADGNTELASLYNPYWQARLVDVTTTEQAAARALKNAF